jgi:hypothetical protein
MNLGYAKSTKPAIQGKVSIISSICRLSKSEIHGSSEENGGY